MFSVLDRCVDWRDANDIAFKTRLLSKLVQPDSVMKKNLLIRYLQKRD